MTMDGDGRLLVTTSAVAGSRLGPRSAAPCAGAAGTAKASPGQPELLPAVPGQRSCVSSPKRSWSSSASTIALIGKNGSLFGFVPSMDMGVPASPSAGGSGLPLVNQPCIQADGAGWSCTIVITFAPEALVRWTPI